MGRNSYYAPNPDRHTEINTYFNIGDEISPPWKIKEEQKECGCFIITDKDDIDLSWSTVYVTTNSHYECNVHKATRIAAEHAMDTKKREDNLLREKEEREINEKFAARKAHILAWLRQLELKRLRDVRKLLLDEHQVNCYFRRGKITIPALSNDHRCMDVLYFRKNNKYTFTR
jgi:hypothetical protein